jgi:hypothetical protein
MGNRKRNKLTIEDIKSRLKKAHKDIVIIVESTYVNTITYATFVDKDFGEWSAKVYSVLQGHGHPDRGRKKTSEKLTMPLEAVKERLIELCGDTVKIKEDTYKNVHTKCIFIDHKYGEWTVTPGDVFQGYGHPDRGNQLNIDARTLTPNEVQERIDLIHSNQILLDKSTYVDTSTVCVFVDIVHGAWTATPNFILMGGGHKNRAREKTKETCMRLHGVEYTSQIPGSREKARETTRKRFGADHALQNPEIAIKVARSSNIAVIKHHWKTGEELVCQGSYEAKTVDHLNIEQINYDWQPQTFSMPNGKTYRPDFYLPEQDIWVEIKGYMRADAQFKWDWFESVHPTAELWNEKKLKEMGIL